MFGPEYVVTEAGTGDSFGVWGTRAEDGGWGKDGRGYGGVGSEADCAWGCYEGR